MFKDDTLPPRAELTISQKALLAQRLQRARLATARAGEIRTSIPLRKPGVDVPLSFAQERLWFLDQLEPGSAVYNVCQAVRVRGQMDSSALEQTLQLIVQRHEVLRTNFVAIDGTPRQVIAPLAALPLATSDLTGLRPEELELELQRQLQEEARRPFNLAGDLLIRAFLAQVSQSEFVLLLTTHHIISDGWSVGVIFRELAAIYGALSTGRVPSLPELPLQFGDYVLWEREKLQGPALQRPLAYWTKQLGGKLPALELPFDHSRVAARMSHGASHHLLLPLPLTQAVKALGQREGATLFMTLLASFQVLLHRWTAQEDIVVGSVVAGRRKVELEPLIGFFVNTLVFRSDLSGDPTFRVFLGKVRETCLAALANQDLPFDRLVQELRPDRDLSRNPLIQVMFVLQNAPMSPTDIPNLNLEPMEVDTGTAKFELTLSMTETARGLQASLEYNADLFERSTITRLLGCFHSLLEGVVAAPDQQISRFSLLSAAERQHMLVSFNPPAPPYPRDRTIGELFAEQAELAAQDIAITFCGTNVTYGELEVRANRLAHRLRHLGVKEESLVAVCMERSIDLIVTLVSVLKAGGAYVSLDLAYPSERLALMLEDTGARVLVTQERLRPIASALADSAGARPRVLCVDAEWASIADEPATRPPCRGGAGSLAYVSYTSGSTGRPKGVCIPHRGVVRLVRNTNYAQFTRDDVFLQFAPVAFDASTLEIWGALLNGARLVVCPPGQPSLGELARVIEEEGVTTLWLTAGLFHQMIDEHSAALRNVRQLLAGGDVLLASHVARALELLPGTQLINGYGPTENTTFTCCHAITTPPEAGRSVPIGRPIANTTVYILDRHLQPVPVGVAGELYTGGDGLARGYLNQPGLTAEKFVSDPFSSSPDARLYRTGDMARWLPDGAVEFLGRADRQVKIRGFRVEPGEVESILSTHPSVRECVVIPRDHAQAGKRLVAYIVGHEASAPVGETWRAYLEGKVPDYLVPSAFVLLDALPLSANGKVDIGALPLGDGGRPDLEAQFIAPRDELEEQIAGIWSDVLGVKPIGVRDRFFDLGGHSLLAVRLVAQLEKKLGRKLPVSSIFQHRTIEQLARVLRSADSRFWPEATSVVEIQAHGHEPPLYLVHGVGGGMFWGYSNLARHMGVGQPIYAFKSRGLDGLPEPESIEQLAASYLADLQAHQPRGPYLLGGYCFGGVVAFEMARQLEARGEQVPLLALINCSPPNSRYDRVESRRSFVWQLKFFRNLAYWAGCFAFRWSMRERVEFLRWKTRLMRRKTGRPDDPEGDDLNVPDVEEMVNLAAYSQEQRRLWHLHVQALRKYRPGSYSGDVTLFRTRGHPLLCSFDEQFGWSDFVRGRIVSRVLPGGHGSILEEPHVRAVARAVEESIRGARTPSRASGYERPELTPSGQYVAAAGAETWPPPR